MKKITKRRSVCPIACSLDILGDKWTLLVVRDLFAGKSRYKDFTTSPERIATNILAERLERLTGAGLVAAKKSHERAGSVTYALTARGKSLFPLLVAMKEWGLANIAGTQARVAVPNP
jgi:DNA-binding HxlR family transcriptional regulator